MMCEEGGRPTGWPPRRSSCGGWSTPEWCGSRKWRFCVCICCGDQEHGLVQQLIHIYAGLRCTRQEDAIGSTGSQEVPQGPLALFHPCMLQLPYVLEAPLLRLHHLDLVLFPCARWQRHARSRRRLCWRVGGRGLWGVMRRPSYAAGRGSGIGQEDKIDAAQRSEICRIMCFPLRLQDTVLEHPKSGQHRSLHKLHVADTPNLCRLLVQQQLGLDGAGAHRGKQPACSMGRQNKMTIRKLLND
eukprot:350457-Chlamydomonas_euryale.AAC.6